MSQESQTVRVTLIGKPDCHLCADARGVIATVCAELGVGWQEVSILDDPELADEYWDKIPVTRRACPALVADSVQRVAELTLGNFVHS